MAKRQKAAPAVQMSDATRTRITKAIADAPDRSDYLDPAYLFACTATDLLLAIEAELIDPVAIAKKTLAGRGVNFDGTWLGFGEAAAIRGIKEGR